MRLNYLRLRNFKGVRDFTLRLDGGDVAVYGTNGTGKTTLVDAYTWLLFGKDSLNQSNFEIKTLDQFNRPIPGLEHEVEAEFALQDGRKVALRKVYREVYTRKRGSAKAEFTGHTTDYFIDGVPVKKAEYDTFVASLGSEETFRLLSDPLYFNEHLHWQKRREILFQVCGDISDTDVIAANASLKQLADVLGGRDVEAFKKMVVAQRAKINEELERIPVRIDEVQRNMPQPPSEPSEVLQAKLASLRAQLEAKRQERVRIEAGGEVAEKRKRVREIEAEQLAVVDSYRREYDEQTASIRRDIAELTAKRSEIQARIEANTRLIATYGARIKQLEERADALRKQWYEENDKQLVFQSDETCPTCGQALPPERIAAAREEALAQFNKAKAERLAAITQEGKTVKRQVEELSAEVQRMTDENEQMKAQIAEIETLLAEQRKSEAEAVAILSKYVDDPKYQQLQQQKVQLQGEIDQLLRNAQAVLVQVDDEIHRLNEQIADIQTELGKYALIEQAQKRIAELREEERRLAAEFEKLESYLFLAEEFVRTKVRLVEANINSRFKISRFKLFRELINGGLEECCEVMLNGVPWNSMNNGGRIQIGLDIIATLSEHFGFAPPLFIDNAESVVDIPWTPGQQIRLLVSADDKSLRVERLDRPKEEQVSQHSGPPNPQTLFDLSFPF